MKAYTLIDDFIIELNQKHKPEMQDFCLLQLDVENNCEYGDHESLE